MLTAAWLGQGTVHLLVRRRGVALALTAFLALVSLLALAWLLAAPSPQAATPSTPPCRSQPQYKEILVRSGLITLLTILLNIYGTLALVGGALYSAFLFWRKKVLANRMLGNLLIAAGALMPAMAGTLLKAGFVDWLYVSEFVGVVIMFLGFNQATVRQAVERSAQASSAADLTAPKQRYPHCGRSAII